MKAYVILFEEDHPDLELGEWTNLEFEDSGAGFESRLRALLGLCDPDRLGRFGVTEAFLISTPPDGSGSFRAHVEAKIYGSFDG